MARPAGTPSRIATRPFAVRLAGSEKSQHSRNILSEISAHSGGAAGRFSERSARAMFLHCDADQPRARRRRCACRLSRSSPTAFAVTRDGRAIDLVTGAPVCLKIGVGGGAAEQTRWSIRGATCCISVRHPRHRRAGRLSARSASRSDSKPGNVAGRVARGDRMCANDCRQPRGSSHACDLTESLSVDDIYRMRTSPRSSRRARRQGIRVERGDRPKPAWRFDTLAARQLRHLHDRSPRRRGVGRPLCLARRLPSAHRIDLGSAWVRSHDALRFTRRGSRGARLRADRRVTRQIDGAPDRSRIVISASSATSDDGPRWGDACCARPRLAAAARFAARSALVRVDATSFRRKRARGQSRAHSAGTTGCRGAASAGGLAAGRAHQVGARRRWRVACRPGSRRCSGVASVLASTARSTCAPDPFARRRTAVRLRRSTQCSTTRTQSRPRRLRRVAGAGRIGGAPPASRRGRSRTAEEGAARAGLRQLRQVIGGLSRREDWVARQTMRRWRWRPRCCAGRRARSAGGARRSKGLRRAHAQRGRARRRRPSSAATRGSTSARLDEAESVIATALAVARRIGDVPRALSASLALGRCLFWKGQLRATRRQRWQLPVAAMRPRLAGSVRWRQSARAAVGTGRYPRRDVAGARSDGTGVASRRFRARGARPRARPHSSTSRSATSTRSGQDVRRCIAAARAAHDPMRRHSRAAASGRKRPPARPRRRRLVRQPRRRMDAGRLPPLIRARVDLLHALTRSSDAGTEAVVARHAGRLGLAGAVALRSAAREAAARIRVW